MGRVQMVDRSSGVTRVARLSNLRRLISVSALALALAVGGMLGTSVSSAAAFTGHGCTKQTCSYFTSSYRGSKYYYKRCDSAWKSLSNSYLQGFQTKTALLDRYPNRVLHKRC